jgi:SAM-dependent methyltransferase
MIQTRPYYTDRGASAAYYDLLTSVDKALVGDLEVYAGLLPAHASVLELGAGTGRIAQGLAERGFRLVGLDIAPAMLAQAEAKRLMAPAEVSERLRYIRGDMTSFELGETFDAVLCTFYALAHLPRGAAWANTFRSVAKHLKPGGVAAFHLPVGEKMAIAPPAADQPVFRQPAGDGRTLTLYVNSQTMNPKIGRMDLVLDYAISGADGVEQSRSRERLTLYSGDPDPFAIAAGFERAQEPTGLGEVGAVYIYRRI